MRVEV